MLNSSIFLQHLMCLWSFPKEKLKSFTYFNPLWFNMYFVEYYREVVLRQIKKQEVFSTNYVLVPIVMWSHRSLLILGHLGESLQQKTNSPCMLLLESLHAAGPRRLEPLIRRIVSDIYKIEERPTPKELLKKIPLLIPKVAFDRLILVIAFIITCEKTLKCGRGNNFRFPNREMARNVAIMSFTTLNCS